MISETLHLECGTARPGSVDGLLQVAMTLPQDKRFTVDIEEVRTKLPDNLRARIKIIVRALAKHLDLTYEQANEIVHDRLYPKMDKTIGGVTYAVFVPTNRLQPDEAREIEVLLYQLCGEIGCHVPQQGELAA